MSMWINGWTDVLNVDREDQRPESEGLSVFLVKRFYGWRYPSGPSLGMLAFCRLCLQYIGSCTDAIFI